MQTTFQSHIPGETKEICGNLHLDDAENWVGDSEMSKRTTSLLPVVLHEIGHTIGLNHSDVRRSIMWPMYDRYFRTHITY
jgi:matrix metalloproteinase-7 (matrilysin)